MSNKRTSPIPVPEGGLGVGTLTTAYGVLCAGTAATGPVQTLNSLGTTGQVLVSQGASSLPHFATISGVVVTLDGDSGSATGSTISLTGQPNQIVTTATASNVHFTLPDAVIIGTTTGVAGSIEASSSSTGGGNGPAALILGRSRSGAAVQSGDHLGVIFIDGFDGTSQTSGATITSDCTGTVSVGIVPANLMLNTTGVGGLGTRITIGQEGNVTVAAPTSGIGLSVASGITASSGSVAVTSGNVNIPTTSSSVGQYQINSVPVLQTSGTQNTFVGANAGSFTAGTSNVCVGYQAGNALTSGSTGNTYVGASAGLVDTGTTDGSTGVGQGSLLAFTGANNAFNTACGARTLGQLLTGLRNTVLGNNAGHNYSSTESDNILIGQGVQGTVSESNTIRIGNGTGSSATQINQTFISGIQGITVTGTAVLVSASDQLGIAVSSRRFKENIDDMGDYSSPLLQLRPVTFNYNVGNDHTLQSGLIAEEVATVMPQLVVMGKDGLPQTVKYHELPVLLLNELAKAVTLINELEERIAALEE